MDWLERILRPLRTGVVTSHYPGAPPVLAQAVRGLPVVDPERCSQERACVDACPTAAIVVASGDAAPSWTLDAGRCVFCAACQAACPTGAIELGDRIELAARQRTSLVVSTAVRGRAR